MAGSQISTSVTIINSLLGYQAVSLTEFTTSAESSIAAGSKVEIGSAFFSFPSDEALTGFSTITTSTTAYIELTPAGTAGTQTVTAAWTATAPVWSDSKQGWYHSAASVTRTIGAAYKTGTTRCESAAIFETKQQDLTGAALQIKRIDIGEWDMMATDSMQVVHGLPYTRIQYVRAVVQNDGGTARYPFNYDDGVNFGGYLSWNNDEVQMAVPSTSVFYTTVFNGTASTVANRGWVLIEYMP